MELLKSSRRKTVVSELIHIILNIALAAAVFALVYIAESYPAAFILVILSKWRVLAVRPRYWKANVIANIVDISVSLSFVVLMYLAGTSSENGIYLQAAMMVFYAIWLIILKPRTGQNSIALQAASSLFLGITAVAAISYQLPVLLVVALAWVIGYGSARHVLASHDETQISLLSIIFGLIVAELVWVSYYWTVGYGVAQWNDLKIPQVAIVALLMGLVAWRVYIAVREKKSLLSADIIVPSLFTTAVTLVMVVLLSSVGPGIV